MNYLRWHPNGSTLERLWIETPGEPGKGRWEDEHPIAEAPATMPAMPVPPVSAWADRTADEAARAGVRRRVLCRDGWYLPER